MEYINEFTGLKFTNIVCRFVTNVVDGILIFGYTNSDKNLQVGKFILKDGNTIKSLYDPKKLKLTWSQYFQDYYYLTYDCKNNPEFLTNLTLMLQPGTYRYSFDKKYEAVQNFKLFDNKQIKIKTENFPIAKYVKRTIGIEFETSLGYISEKDCFDYGLIPLRDGSISGIEYSTVILQGDNGFNLLKKQLELLQNYTHFNKECSLHIHFGDFPLKPTKIYRLYKLLFSIQNEILEYVPEYTFRTERYKANGKSYCQRSPEFGSFDKMFTFLTNQTFFGDFTQPHPNDPTRMHKWNVPTRYYWCNFINLLCYNVNKTVEFRFLRPTYNLEKILTWIYILNAFLVYAEGTGSLMNLSIQGIIRSVYPTSVVTMLEEELAKLGSLRACQTMNCDYIGADLVLENRFFDSNKII